AHSLSMGETRWMRKRSPAKVFTTLVSAGRHLRRSRGARMSRAQFKTSTWMEQRERCEDRNHRRSTAPVHQDRRGEPEAARTAPGDPGAYRAALRLRNVGSL